MGKGFPGEVRQNREIRRAVQMVERGRQCEERSGASGLQALETKHLIFLTSVMIFSTLPDGLPVLLLGEKGM